MYKTHTCNMDGPYNMPLSWVTLFRLSLKTYVVSMPEGPEKHSVILPSEHDIAGYSSFREGDVKSSSACD